MTILTKELFHGSRHGDIEKLDTRHGDETRPFGPGLYLTDDLDVANCYVRGSGCVYEVKVSGRSELTIDLDAPFVHQSADAQAAISRLYRSVHMAMNFHSEDKVRMVIDAVTGSWGSHVRPGERNRRLESFGIWLLYGHLEADEKSGLCDRGTQYVAISDSAIIAQRRQHRLDCRW